jgi:Cysteine-rich secretory protein family/F5/8 type C domain
VLRVLSIIGLVLALMSPISADAAPGGNAVSLATGPAAVQVYCADPEEFELFISINEYRTAHGLAPFTLSLTLGAAATHHSDSMAAFNYFDAGHDLHFEGVGQDETVSWQQNIANFGYPDSTRTSRAESVAAGYESAIETLAQWKGSPSHNDHLLSTQFQAIGIGRAFDPDSDYGWYWTVTFGSLVDSTAEACPEIATADADPVSGSRLSVVRSGRNGSSTDSSVVYDGNETTIWYTTKARTPASGYVWIDLGAPAAIARIDYLFTTGDYADSFDIQISLDGETWTTIATPDRPAAGEWMSLDWSGETRFIRFYFTNPDGEDVLGHLAEVRVIAQ